MEKQIEIEVQKPDLSWLPTPPAVPRAHPLGDDYLAVTDIIADVWEKANEYEKLKGEFKQTIAHIERYKSAFDIFWAREFGDGLLIGARDRIKKDLFG